jgi:hypothetical protein
MPTPPSATILDRPAPPFSTAVNDSFENKNDLVMPVESPPTSAG